MAVAWKRPIMHDKIPWMKKNQRWLQLWNLNWKPLKEMLWTRGFDFWPIWKQCSTWLAVGGNRDLSIIYSYLSIYPPTHPFTHPHNSHNGTVLGGLVPGSRPWDQDLECNWFLEDSSLKTPIGQWRTERVKGKTGKKRCVDEHRVELSCWVLLRA